MNHLVFSTDNDGSTDIILEGEFDTLEEAEEFQRTLNGRTWIKEHGKGDAIIADGFGEHMLQWLNTSK